MAVKVFFQTVIRWFKDSSQDKLPENILQFTWNIINLFYYLLFQMQMSLKQANILLDRKQR